MVAMIGLLTVFVLIMLRVPVGVAMIGVGFLGFASIAGVRPAAFMTAQTAFSTVNSYSLSVVPLFLLMGNLINRSRISADLYDAAHAAFGHFRGGLAQATILACGGFAAISGSSMATTASMGRVAYPSMRRYGYADILSTGSIAAGGTLGILIPPSVVLLVYGILTETSISKLFIAGILPGLLAVALYMLTIAVIARLRPDWGPAGARTDRAERRRKLARVWPVLALFALVMGGIYGGIFTPTEAAGVGALGALLFALARRALNWRSLFDTLTETAVTSAMIFFVIVGAMVLGNFLNIAGLPSMLGGLINALDLSPFWVMVIICVIYVLLGMVLESMSMILLTIPILFPIVVGLGYDPVWFGILIVMVVELALISPPIGLNVYVLRSVLPHVPLRTLFAGVFLFLVADLVKLVLVVLFPGIVLWLPSMM
ncbi:TRAP transporter large permease [Chelativorans intermedius]|uniref:TRAP transporter large permease protein n=1 Tax=Chelativorans intermedius TaxID=515947 RepID=A0ABV6D684_9HYPH|nr:TRAP transporter large permease [Chelativorans intermedius]MCT8997428.1 TRAP transporter large permease [Chelativorans intermedius]